MEQVTKGGIFLPQSAVDRDEISEDRGVLVKASPLAFGYAEWPEGKEPPQPGDRVLLAQYDGKVHEFDGVKYRVVKDKSVVGWWPAEQPVLAAAA